MELGKLLTEGKGKRVYATDDPDQAIVYFKDEAMAFHGLKRGRILGKGEVNNAISEQFFKMLEENGIPTHYLRRLDARQSLVKRCQILPVSVKVRNRVAGSLAKRIGLPTGTKLDTTVIELELKGSEMDYPLINITHVEALHLATREEMNYVIETARKINQILSDFTSEIGVELVDFKLEFGRYHGQLLVADSDLVLIPTVTAIIGRLYVRVNRGQNPLEVSRLIACTLGGVDIDIFNIQPQRDRTLP